MNVNLPQNPQESKGPLSVKFGDASLAQRFSRFKRIFWAKFSDVCLEFRDGMGLKMGNGISPCLFAFSRSGVWQPIPKSLLVFRRKLLFSCSLALRVQLPLLLCNCTVGKKPHAVPFQTCPLLHANLQAKIFSENFAFLLDVLGLDILHDQAHFCPSYSVISFCEWCPHRLALTHMHTFTGGYGAPLHCIKDICLLY